MLFQATVPNTWASGQASKAAWKPKPLKQIEIQQAELGARPTTVCECGLRRYVSQTACPRCQHFEGFPDFSSFDDEVFGHFVEAPNGLTIGELVLFFPKVERGDLYRACRRLITAGRMKRKAIDKPGEAYLYKVA
jgi:hypothetical protein